MWHLASNVECLAECARRVRIPASRLKIKAKRGLAMTRWIPMDSNGTPMELRRNRLAMVRRARALREAFKGTHTKCPSAKEHSEDKELSERSLARNVHHRPLAERLHAQPLPLSGCLHRLWCTTGEAFQKSFEGKRVKIWKRLAS